MGCLNSIFEMCPDKRFVQGEKNIAGKGREGSFQVKQHPLGFIGSADDTIEGVSDMNRTATST